MKTCLALVVFLVFCKSPGAVAGPPLSIDDPGVLDPGRWEIIGATTLTSGSQGDYWQAPLLDVSLGVIEDHVQIGFVYPYAHADSGDEGLQSDFGNAEIGVKWRFYKTERLQMALAPYHAFGVSTRTAGKTDTDFDDEFIELRAGFDAALSDSIHLLFSIATGIQEPSGAGELDYDTFLGLQVFP